MKNFLGKFLLCIIIIFLVLIFYNLTEVKAAGGNYYITVSCYFLITVFTICQKSDS